MNFEKFRKSGDDRDLFETSEICLNLEESDACSWETPGSALEKVKSDE